MIEIQEIHTELMDSNAYLIAKIRFGENVVGKWIEQSKIIDTKIGQRYKTTYLNDNCFDLWYRVSNEYSEFLCYERCDAFILAMLYFAIITEQDIKSTVPITKKLKYQLTTCIIPALCDSGNLRHINIVADTADEIEKHSSAVGTGTSCGIDSFTSILLHMPEHCDIDDYQLTHLTLFNTGSLNFDGYDKDVSLDEWREQTLKEFDERIDRAKQVSKKLNLKFIWIDSNIPDLYQGAFAFSHTFRNCSAVLATQKLWSVYYYASAGLEIDIYTKITKDCAYYDFLTIPNISLSNLQFHLAGGVYRRLKKTEIISENPIVQTHLNVCSYSADTNCGKCDKCIRTLSALDILQKKDKFAKAFPNMNYYENNRNKIMAGILLSKKTDDFRYDMKCYIKNNNIHTSFKVKMHMLTLPVKSFIKGLIFRNGK